MKYIIPTIIILLTLSCSLDRTNPLDPFVSDEGYPGKVHNILVATTENNTIMIIWEPLSSIDGYYIYRSQSYDGLYELIEDDINKEASNYEDHDVENILTVWYKMSAYILVNDKKLEGYRSEPKTWN